MTQEQKLKNLMPPAGRVDAVIDTDAFNEIDDQFAISYMLKLSDRINTRAIYAAPCLNGKVKTPAEGMELSYKEIYKLLSLMGREETVLRGSEEFLKNENTPVMSEAARDLAERAKAYSPEKPLYVVAIGAITNVASALLIEPLVAENTVVIWLGGHAHHYHDTKEFNMKQDIAAARVVFGSGVPLVQLPCMGVVSEFTVTRQDLRYWFCDKDPLSDYLARNAVELIDQRAPEGAYAKALWDVTAVAWLINESDKFMFSRVVNARLPDYDGVYGEENRELPIRYVYSIKVNKLMNDLIEKLTK